MRSRAEWNALRETFFQALDRMQGVTLAVREVGCPVSIRIPYNTTETEEV